MTDPTEITPDPTQDYALAAQADRSNLSIELTWGLIEAMRVGAQAFAEALPTRLDERTVSEMFDIIRSNRENLSPRKYDPLHDDPPFPPDPAGSAPLAQQKLASLVFLSAVGRINAEYGRGATSEEITEFALKAGYERGNSVNGWTTRPGKKSGAIELDEDKNRWLNEDGRNSVYRHAKSLNLEIVGDIYPLP